MNRSLVILKNLLSMYGINPIKLKYLIQGLPFYIRDYAALKAQQSLAVEKFPLGSLYPCLEDRFKESGAAKGHYFHQDLLVARRIHSNNPIRHVDVGSSIEGFVAHVASFRPIEVFDVRPLSIAIPNIHFVQADMMTPLPDSLVDYCDSLSCLHALEHFGLGRYGDPIQYGGYLMGLSNFHRILKTGGKLYISVPIGPQRIEFNAHRVFSAGHLLKCFEGKYRLDCFSYIDDSGNLHQNAPLVESAVANNYGCTYGCGIMELSKY